MITELMDQVEKAVGIKEPLMKVFPTFTKCPSSASSDFGEFDDCGDIALVSMRGACVDFMSEIQRDPTAGRWLSLLGKSGIGKSMLARCVWELAKSRFVFSESYSPRIDDYRGGMQFLDWRKFMGRMRSGSSDINYELTRIVHRDFLVIDDLGTELDKRELSFGADLSDQILAGRSGKWTLITCNKFLDKIAEEMDVRIASRMRRDGNVCVQASAMDYSLRNL